MLEYDQSFGGEASTHLIEGIRNLGDLDLLINNILSKISILLLGEVFSSYSLAILFYDFGYNSTLFPEFYLDIRLTVEKLIIK